MIAPEREIQKAVYDLLKGTGDVMELVDGVYDRVPANPFGPKSGYISFGSTDSIFDDADCVVAEDITFQLTAWSRQVGSLHCKDICHAVKLVLHEADLVLVDNALVQVRQVLRIISTTSDGLTTQGAMQFTASIEIPA